MHQKSLFFKLLPLQMRPSGEQGEVFHPQNYEVQQITCGKNDSHDQSRENSAEEHFGIHGHHRHDHRRTDGVAAGEADLFGKCQRHQVKQHRSHLQGESLQKKYSFLTKNNLFHCSQDLL